MKRHVLLTGEIGAGKSVALMRTLALLGGVRTAGVQTYYPEPRGAQSKTLYLRPWGSAEQGELLMRIPGDDFSRIVPVFDTVAGALLDEARAHAQLIVIDECGRLESGAMRYHEALRRCLDGDVPVLCAIRKHRAPWADWVRNHPKEMLLEVTPDNRDGIPQQAAALLAQHIAR